MAWATEVGTHWEKIEAEYNAEWAKLAYLDGPGYTVWDRIEAKSDLQRRYFSRSYSHGVVNSPVETLTQTTRVESSRELGRGKVESNRQQNSRMSEYAREIRESCERMISLLQEQIDVSESSMDMDASELMSESLPISDEIHPSTKSIEEHFVTDKSVCAENLMVDRSDLNIGIATTGLKESIPSTATQPSSSLMIFAFPLIKPLGGELFSMGCTRASSWEDVVRQWCGSHARLSPPPPKPPNRSLRQRKMELQVTMDRSMSPPHPKPPDDNPGAVDTIVFPSCVEMAVWPPSVCENVCVHDCVIIQLLLFMLFQSSPPVRHHIEKDHEQVILVVYLGVGSYAPISLDYGYTMNVFEKIEVYGYGVVLLIVLTCKHIDGKWKQEPHLHMVTYEKREFGNLVFDKVHIHQQPPKTFMSLGGVSLRITRTIQCFQELPNPNVKNVTSVSVVWYGNILQHLHHLSLEPYHAHFWSWVNDHTHSDAMKIVELFLFVVTGVVIVPEGMSIVLALRLAFSMKLIKYAKVPSAEFLSAKYHGLILFSEITWSFMVSLITKHSSHIEVLRLFYIFFSNCNKKPRGYILAKNIETCMQFGDFNPTFVNLIGSTIHVIIGISLHVQVFVYVNLDANGEKSLARIMVSSPSASFLSLIIEKWLNTTMEIVRLISFAATEGSLLAMTLSLAIAKMSSNGCGNKYVAVKQMGNHGNITCTPPYIFLCNIMYVEISCYDFSKLIDICEIGPWALIDLTINLCKVIVVIDDKPHAMSFYEDVLVHRSYFDPKQLNPLMNYVILDSWPTSAISNSVGAWITHSGSNVYHVVDWHIAWVSKVVGSIFSVQKRDSPPVKHQCFKQWDPGVFSCDNFNLKDKVDFNGGGNVMIPIEESKSASLYEM